MTVFDTRFAASGFPSLLREFGESVTYYPRGGGSRSITAIVDREPPEFFDGVQAVQPSFTVRVYNDDSTGISSDEIDIGGDDISLPLRIGTTAQRRSVMKLMSQGSGVTVIAVR